MSKPDGYIVVFDDENAVLSTFGWSEECEGALGGGWPVVVFPSHAAARKAITISKRNAKLCEAQGKPVDTDWLPECSRCIKIIPVVFAPDVPRKEATDGHQQTT